MTEWDYSPTVGINVKRENITVSPERLHEAVGQQLEKGARLALASAIDDTEQIRLVYAFVLPNPDLRTEISVNLPSDDPVITSLAPLSFPASRFEREFHDLFGVKIANHPMPRRLVRHGHWLPTWYPMRHNAGVAKFSHEDDPGYPFVPVKGTGIYEIPVGPIHAGLIEPGHFRFYAVGETIVKLKIRLWFLHKGLEKLFEGMEPTAGVALAEKISGDSSVGHSLAYVLAVEEALGITVNPDVALARAMLLELERLYNHVADVGAMANDVGYSVANSHALALREELLQMNRGITGNRLLRGAIKIGGVSLVGDLNLDQLRKVAESFQELAGIIVNNPMVRERFTHTATLHRADALLLGALGPVARSVGIATDARISHPFVEVPIETVLEASGDVLARFSLRVKEFEASAKLLSQFGSILSDHALPNGKLVAARRDAPKRQGFGLVEGWRGTIANRVELDDSRYLSRVKVVDPSWFNWPALPLAMAETIVPDFPLANKSFNLSYSGNDL